MRKWGLPNILIAAIAALVLITPIPALAESSNTATTQIYRLGKALNAGHDKGYAENNEIKSGDPHFGWELGSFFVTGFTAVSRGDDGTPPTFLKTGDDAITLYFRLNQDINCLNGNENLVISKDSNGYDERFGIEKTDFGRGALIMRKTNHDNVEDKPQVYTNYLEATCTPGADTQVVICEEGDYEVSLDYEIKDSPRKIPIVNWEVIPTYSDYKINFSFSVRNGNTMVFPFDISTNEELINTSVTPNGFYIDLAQSKYLNVNVKRSVMVEKNGEYSEDVRFNEPAEDGSRYTNEGIYTITATNPTTGQTTEKKIYVGENDVMKAYVSSSYSISDIKQMIAQGASVDEQGNIQLASKQNNSVSDATTDKKDAESPSSGLLLACIVAIAAIAIIAIMLKRKGKTLLPSNSQPKAITSGSLSDKKHSTPDNESDN